MRSSHSATRCGVLVAICATAWLIYAVGCSSSEPLSSQPDQSPLASSAVPPEDATHGKRAAPPQASVPRTDGTKGQAGVTTTDDGHIRGLWVATAYNQDWPSKDGMHRRLQRDEIAGIVKRAKDLKCNVIYLQVRAFGDRIQRETSLAADSQTGSSKFIYVNEPWAVSLNGGNDPVPKGANDKIKYDPLGEWIKQCKNAGIELHLWINPFRVNKPVRVWTKEADPKKRTTYWLPLIEWKRQMYLDPSSPAVQDYVSAVIADLLKNYPPEVDSDNTEDRKLGVIHGDGPEGVVYDHNLPPEPPYGVGDAIKKPVPQPTTKPNHEPTSPAEKALHEYLDMYWTDKSLRIPEHLKLKLTMKSFLDRSFDLIRERSGRFGLSPMAKKDQEAFAYVMAQLQGGSVDYVIPELYTEKNLANFDADLKTWLDAVPQGDDPPIIIAGLNTARVQAPSKPLDAEPDWDAKVIEDQMARGEGLDGRRQGEGKAGSGGGALLGRRLAYPRTIRTRRSRAPHRASLDRQAL